MVLRILGRQLVSEVTAPNYSHSDHEGALLGFVCTPYHAERVLTFGTFMALDAFLHALVILPLRAIYGLWQGHSTRWRKWNQTGYGQDVFQVIVIIATYKVLQGVNTSRVYYNLRGQTGITMFVLYSLMEVCDKFLCSVGHEITACISSKRTMQSAQRTLLFGLVNFVYTVVHSLVLMWHLVTINLASNSYSNALLSFILTNQFGEIKSAVFKRFDIETLFQLTCADITQRFQFSAILSVIVLRNLVELSSLTDYSAIKRIVGPPALIMGATVLADWVKMAYITNFNNIVSSTAFQGYMKRLRDDYIDHGPREPQTLMSNQTGLPVAPLAIVCVRMFAKGGDITTWETPVVYVILLVVKLALSSCLYGIASGSSKNAEVTSIEPKKNKPRNNASKNNAKKRQ